MNNNYSNYSKKEFTFQHLILAIAATFIICLLFRWCDTTTDTDTTTTITDQEQSTHQVDCSRAISTSIKLIEDWVSYLDYQNNLLQEQWCDQLTHDDIKWYPGVLSDDWTHQDIPSIEWETSHDRFKAIAERYWLDASLFREVENKYNLREWLLLAVVIAETSWGKKWYWTSTCNNPANNNNNDRWIRVCYDDFKSWLEAAAQTLNNKYLWTTQTLGCLSKAGSCKWREDKWHIYASSEGNRERNMIAVLNSIYWKELWDIDPARFNVRRTFTIYQ